ncbi:MAG: ATP-binding protein [Pseudomonadota bacterium]
MIWKRISLRTRIFLILALLVLIILGGGLVMVWYTYRMEALFASLISSDFAALQVVEGLETDLANQKGLVSYYFIDGDVNWLKQLDEYRERFKEQLNDVRKYAFFKADVQIIDKIASEYLRYIKDKDQVIALYKAGKREQGAKLHQAVRSQFFKILDLCDSYKHLHYQKINQTRNNSRSQAKRLRIIAGTAMSTAFLLGVLLAGILVTQILDPLRKLAFETNRSDNAEKPGNEIVTLSHRVRGLIKDMDSTKIELERSREHLLQSEKLALVGKLAAGVAHSIRNPLTSVKMRLFSMERSLDLSPTQKEDFEVVSGEIRHIENIVKNFLEFSRPPKLKMQKVSPSDVVDNILQLLRHRLDSYNVEIKLKRPRRLPEVLADPEQLKEVFVNLIVNACEAMTNGGVIVIREEEGFKEQIGRAAIVRVKDNGPGIPKGIQEKVFQPFFSTKEEGTGLGLAIVARIVNEHGGWINLESQEGKGATFIIILPLKKEEI